MFKGLLICYAVVLSTFFTVAIAGYWAFGNEAQGNLFLNLEAYVPKWLNFLSNILVMGQLIAVALVSTITVSTTFLSPTNEGKFLETVSDKLGLHFDCRCIHNPHSKSSRAGRQMWRRANMPSGT